MPGLAYFQDNLDNISDQTIIVFGNVWNRRLKSRFIILFICCIRVDTTLLPPRLTMITFGVGWKPIHWIVLGNSCQYIPLLPYQFTFRLKRSRWRLALFNLLAPSLAQWTIESLIMQISEMTLALTNRYASYVNLTWSESNVFVVGTRFPAAH